jgi:hypothetical protein
VPPVDYGWLLLVSILFGVANGISHGRWQQLAFFLLLGTLGLLGWRFGRARTGGPSLKRHVVFALVLVLPIFGLADPKILAQAVLPTAILRPAQIANLLLLLSYTPFLDGKRKESTQIQNLRFFALAAVLVAGGIATIHITPVPGIDVWTIQQEAGHLLRAGKNPYQWVALPDSDPENTFTVPFVYPPAAVYTSFLGVNLFGDCRYIQLAAMVIAGFALRAIARARSVGTTISTFEQEAPTLVFWLTPLLWMVVELSWVDPIQIALITVATAAFVTNRRAAAAVIFGVACSSKQTMFFLVPLAGVILRFTIREWILFAVGAATPVLPFLIWDWRALKAANFDLLANLPPRRDALCFTNAIWKFFHANYPPASAFLFGAGATALATWRGYKQAARRTPVDFARALVFTYFVFFFFNRWAFANYYFLLTGLSALSAAAALGKEESRE